MQPVSRASIQAYLEVATEEEQREEQQRLQSRSWIGTLAEKTWNYVVDKVNTIALLRFDTRTISGWYIHRDPFLYPLRIANQVIHLSKHPQVMEAILRRHRDDGPFSMATNNGLTETLQEYFPEEGLQRNDVIMLCNPESTRIYRSFLHTFFTPQHLATAHASIEKLISNTIRLWGMNQGTLNLSEATRQYTCGIIARLFLGHDSPNFEVLCLAIKTAILRISDNALKRKNVTEDAFVTSRRVLHYAIKSTFTAQNQDHVTIVQAMKEANFSDAQIYAMIFTLFLAGQDTSSTAITYTLLKCAQNPHLQDLIRNDIAQKQQEGLLYRQAIASSTVLQSVMAESLRMMPPISGIGRYMGQNAVLKVTENERLIRRYYIHAGERLIVVPAYLARDPSLVGNNANEFQPHRHINQRNLSSLVTLPWMPFGYWVHRCPGWALFQLEASWLIADLLRMYQLSTSFVGEPEQYTAFTNGPKHDLFMSLHQRTSF